jgi:NADH-quinone oxidoreductase chain G
MTKVYVNDVEVFMKQGSTALQACEAVGIEVPRFCYHERLSIAGNCRMCLVEIEKTPKPVASCAMPLMEGMKIYTDTPLVKKAREAVLEFLLLNHPLDCPICDQGGECDLQDQALVFGSDRSRFYETKRTVEDKNYGPLVKTIMTRCIHCTRCVRFATEIAGIEDLGATGRGNETEIGTYIGSTMKSELSGNVIDLCPVGALTSKPYAFTSRPWEIKNSNSVDTSDGLGSNIRIDFRGTEVLRILPRLHEDINEEWISDKTRFAYDGLKRQRILHPYESWVHSFPNFYELSWEDVFSKYHDGVSTFLSKDPSSIRMSIGGDSNLETILAAKDLSHTLGIRNLEYKSFNSLLDNTSRNNYSFNGTIGDIENADTCLIINTNPKYDATLLNARLRKRFLKGNFSVGLIGSYTDLTFPFTHIGSSIEALIQVVEGKHSFCKKLMSGSNVRVIFCNEGEVNTFSAEIFYELKDKLASLLLDIKSIKTTLSYLHTGANTVGALDLGISQSVNTTPQVNYFIDSGDYLRINLFSSNIETKFWLKAQNSSPRSRVNTRFLYQGHHVDARRPEPSCMLLLPGAAFTEERSLYVNTEGRCQKANRIFKPAYSIRENWKILRAFGNGSIKEWYSPTYNTYKELITRLEKLVPSVQNLDSLTDSESLTFINNKQMYNKDLLSSFSPLVAQIDNYYTTSFITRASQTMAECSSSFLKKVNF